MQTVYPSDAVLFDAFQPRNRWSGIVLVSALGLIALNFFDLVLTHRLLASGVGSEANPLMAPLILGAGIWWVKLGLPIVLGWVHVSRPATGMRALLLVAVVGIFCEVVIWNAHLLAMVNR